MSSNNNGAVMLFNGSLQIPAHVMVNEPDELTRNLAGGSGGLRVSIRGSVFRLMRDGDEIAKNEERAMNFVIVRSSPDASRTFYVEKWKEGEDPKPPTCWSTDGTTPDAEVKAKQSPKCATCPQNVGGSGDNGSRACRYSRRLAVVPDNDIAGNVYQCILPAQSIFGKAEADGKMPLQAYAKQLAQHKIAANRVLTEFRFDTDSSTPKLTFKMARWLTVEECAIVEQQGNTQAAHDAIKMTVFAQDNGGSNDGHDEQFEQAAAPAKAAPAPVSSATVAPPAPAAAPAPAPAAEPEKKTRSRTPKAAPGAAPAATAPATSTSGTNAPSQAAPAAPKPPAPPAPPAPAVPTKKMTAAANGVTYQAYVDAGWSDQQMLDAGVMVIEMVAPAAPIVVLPPAPPPAPATAGVASMLATMDDDDA